MEETFYQILAKASLDEIDKRKLEKMFKRLSQEIDLLKTIFNKISLENKRILDIGTGQEFACKFLVENARNSLIVTIDRDPLCLNRVRNILGDKINNLVFIKADLSALLFIKNNFFDIALAHYTISTIEKDKLIRVLEEVHRILVPNGWLVIIEGFGIGKKDHPRELTLELEEIYREITKEEKELELENLLLILNKFSKFKLIEVKKLNDGLLDPTIEDFAYYLLKLTNDTELRNRIKEIIKKGRRIGFREAPDYVIYLQK